MKMNKNLVSVIIPAYNHEKYIQGAIKSIINQTYKNIELIVIDDGSTDSTWEKIIELEDECKNRFVNVIFKTKKNEGTCETYNKLLASSCGEFVYFIASDDLAKPCAIEKEVNFLSKNLDYSLVVGDNDIIDSNNTICYWNQDRNIVYDESKAIYKTFSQYLKKYRKDFKFNSDDFGRYKTLYRNNYVPNGYLIRKSIFDIIGNFSKEAPIEDCYLMRQIAKYSKMKYLNEVLFSYRWHSKNTIKQTEKINNMKILTDKYEDLILKNIDLNRVSAQFKKDLAELKKIGVCLKKIGIPKVFEILKYEKNGIISKYVKVFSWTVKI